MKIFAPPLDTSWRMEHFWNTPQSVIDRNDNGETIHGEKGYQFDTFTADTGIPTTGQDWVKAFHAWQKAKRVERGIPEFVKGTVFTVERYHVSRSGEDQITLRVRASPEQRLHPKKQGGQMRGMGRLYLSIEEFNTLPDLEQVNDLIP